MDRETEWQQHLGDFKDELISTKMYVEEFLKQANGKIASLQREHEAKENEMVRSFGRVNEQVLDSVLRVCVRIQESLNFYNEGKEIWVRLYELLSELDESAKILYDHQPSANIYRSLISVKNMFDATFNYTMAVKLDYNQVWISSSQEYANRSAKVEEITKNFDTKHDNYTIKNKQIEYDNAIRVAIRSQEQVDFSLAILRPIERVVDLLKTVKSKLMVMFPQQW